MKISESDARTWYETNGIADTDWNDFEDFTREMIAVEAIADDWDEVDQMRETGIPESAVLIYFNVTECGLDEGEVEYLDEEDSYEGLTSYVMQNTSSSNLKSLFDDSEVTVLSVDALEGSNGEMYVRVEVEGSASIFA